jgi:hypothetical protein
LPEIDRVVRALKLEVTTDMLVHQDEEQANSLPEKEDSHAPVSRLIPARERFFLKTGLRIPVQSGKLGLLSETFASYGDVSSFFKVRLDGRFDSDLGIIYAIEKDVRLQVERQIVHGSGAAAGEGALTEHVVQLVYVF